MSRRLEEFKPIEDEKVRMYTCGPSIYQLPHLGNYRTFLFEDVLQRYLEYLEYKVERVLNITDVEDKAIAEAEKEGTPLRNITERNAKMFLKELKLLRVKTPDYLPRSSTSIDQAVHLIEELLKMRYAYWHGGNVYYDPVKFKGFGKLFRLDMTRWPKVKRRFHKDTYPGNRWNLGDFILWHGYKQGDKVYWDTALGKGRPAWNIQDPAMATQHLGFKVDIACGGIDNMIRHHDYIIAVVEAVSDEEFARYWLHGAHLYVDGKKMSKSVGNIIYPKDLIERGCEWQSIRFFLINGHYSKRLNFTFDKFKEACDRLQKFHRMVNNLQNAKTITHGSNPKAKELIAKLKKDFEENMNNDLHVKDAFDALFDTVSKLVSFKEKGKLKREDAEGAAKTMRKIDKVLQVIF
jgi:cysteinyl-tRNA synthetase